MVDLVVRDSVEKRAVLFFIAVHSWVWLLRALPDWGHGVRNLAFAVSSPVFLATDRESVSVPGVVFSLIICFDWRRLTRLVFRSDPWPVCKRTATPCDRPSPRWRRRWGRICCPSCPVTTSTRWTGSTMRSSRWEELAFFSRAVRAALRAECH